MKNLSRVNNPYNDEKVISQCSIFGMMDTSGKLHSGKEVMRAIGNMHERGNGLGGGLAVYGCYPEHPDEYALHIMYTIPTSRKETEAYSTSALRKRFPLSRRNPSRTLRMSTVTSSSPTERMSTRSSRMTISLRGSCLR